MASTIKVDNVQNQPGTNIVSKCGTDVTLGASGDTVALASGASQTGFGRTGTVDWDTSIKTGTVTAATGSGYFVDTTLGGITVNLPAGVVGSIVAVSDYASTAASNNITIAPNGSEKINGVNDDYTISTAGLAITLVYADAARGWKSVTGSDADATGVVPAYIVATGGNQPTSSGCIVCTNYKVHKFTGPGTFCVSAGAGPLALADYLVVAGGGGGGANYGGGGGGGGFRESPGTASGCYTTSPRGTSPAVALTLSPQGYPITVGGGGAAGTFPGSPYIGGTGSDSIFSSITSAGGGGGADEDLAGNAGGSGGGGSYITEAGGAGNTPAAPVAQGMDGGAGGPGSPNFTSGGGGGATETGVAGAVPGNTSSARGGAGADTSISASPVDYSGGGGGGGGDSSGAGGAASPCGTGGAGGPQSPSTAGTAGTINKGGGGGGATSFPGAPSGSGGGGGLGGSGVVWIRYKFQ